MKPRRQRLQVSTFPFLAVLLCAMGSLILLLLVIDRQAKIAARKKALLAATQSIEAGKQRAAERQAEWERRRLELQQLLTSQRDALAGQLHTARGQADASTRDLSEEEARQRELRRRLEALRRALHQAEGEVQEGSTRVGEATRQEQATRTALARQTAELEQLERTLKDLQELRRRQSQMWSLVPYKGKRGDNRRPLYLECTAGGVIFHPDHLALDGLNFSSEALRAEVERRVARLREQTPGEKVPQGEERAAYLMMLVRPDGIGHYYQTMAALDGVKVDFGYEFVDGDWVLDFPEDDSAPAQPWMIAGQGTMPRTGGDQEGTSQGASRKPAAASGGLPLPGVPPGVAQGRGGAPGGVPGGTPGQHGPGSGGAGGPGALGTPGGSPGVPMGVAQGRGGVPGVMAGQPGLGGGTGMPGALGVPGGRPGILTGTGPGRGDLAGAGPGLSGGPALPGARGGASAGPGGTANGPSASPSGQGTGTGETSGEGSGQKVADTGLWKLPAIGPQAPPGNSGPAQQGGGTGIAQGGPVAGPRPGSGQGMTAGEESTSGQPGKQGVGDRSAGLLPVLLPGEGSAGGPRGSGIPGAGGGISGGGGGPGEPGEPGQSQGPRLLRGGGEGKPAAAPPLPRLFGNRDWVLAIECRADEVVLKPWGYRFAVGRSSGAPGGEHPLVQKVRQLIARRQASVRPGEPPYRPLLRFQVRPDGLRAYYFAYPLLESLRVPMSRENLE